MHRRQIGQTLKTDKRITMKHVFIFDLDNTLVKTNRANNLSYQEAIRLVLGEDVQMGCHRFTRKDLSTSFSNILPLQISQITTLKESLFVEYLKETELNVQLAKCLRILKENGNETILLTESRKKRAQQVCDYYALTKYFHKKYYSEDCCDGNKFQFLKTRGIPLCSVVLFENERHEIQRAIQNGIPENQIIKIKF